MSHSCEYIDVVYVSIHYFDHLLTDYLLIEYVTDNGKQREGKAGQNRGFGFFLLKNTSYNIPLMCIMLYLCQNPMVRDAPFNIGVRGEKSFEKLVCF